MILEWFSSSSGSTLIQYCSVFPPINNNQSFYHFVAPNVLNLPSTFNKSVIWCIRQLVDCDNEITTLSSPFKHSTQVSNKIFSSQNQISIPHFQGNYCLMSFQITICVHYLYPSHGHFTTFHRNSYFQTVSENRKYVPINGQYFRPILCS